MCEFFRKHLKRIPFISSSFICIIKRLQDNEMPRRNFVENMSNIFQAENLFTLFIEARQPFIKHTKIYTTTDCSR